jgi:serine/threonine protein kinase
VSEGREGPGMSDRISPERWRVVIPYLDAALELDESDRTAWLHALRQQDASLAADVAALLEKHDVLDAQGYLEGGVQGHTRPTSMAGQVLGAYTLREPLGQGGMGTVWLADRTDGRYQGTAAVKLLNASLVGREGEDRFRREGSILARLRHPNIAQLIDAGVSDAGQPYLVLEHVDGLRIDRWCDARGLGVEARVRLFLDVLSAVAHAHANLVVHRDLKPSNVMVGEDGRVKLLDFGIAKLVGPEPGDATAFTGTGARLMTPQYAAPEQLTGEDVTTATDVYALGVLLYVLLTGRHPSGGETSSPAELVRAIVDTEPPRPSEAVRDEPPGSDAPAAHRGTTPRGLSSALRGDLDNVVTKALKKRPAERYASAEGLADDLRRYLDRRPVRARKDSLSYRARKFAARNRLALSAGALAVAALVAASVYGLTQAARAAGQRDRALAQLRRAEAALDFTGFLLAEATPTEKRPLTNAELMARGEAVLDRRYAHDPATRVELLLMMAKQYEDSQLYDKWREATGRAYAESRSLGDDGLRARASCARAASLSDLGPSHEESKGAEALLAQAIADVRGVPDAAADEAFCLVAEAGIANNKGEGSRAIAAGRRAVALEQALGAPVKRRLYAGLVLADAYASNDAPQDADREYRDLLTLLDAQGLGDSRDAASILNNLAVLWVNVGQPLRALPFAERAERVGRERDVERGVGASILRTYGVVLLATGRAREAVPPIEESVARARAEGTPRRVLNALTWLANAQAEAGSFAQADETVSSAAELVRNDPRAIPAYHALIDRTRARIALARGDSAAALRHARAAGAHGQDALLVDERMRIDQVLAEAANGQSEFVVAREAAERALQTALERLRGLSESADAGRARLERGIARVHLGDRAPGLEDVRRAQAEIEASAGPSSRIAVRARQQRALLSGAAPAP